MRGMDAFTERALGLLTSSQLADALDLSKEDPRVVERYGSGDPTVFMDENGAPRVPQSMLVARRLIEAGVRSVEITLAGFDTHARNFAGHTSQAKLLDPALAALVGDLEDRDLLESTVVLVMGEFGRTPSINPLDGRDHWPHGFSCLLGGAGIAAGQVIGSTDPEGVAKLPTDPVEIHDLSATVLAALGIDFAREVATLVGRPMKLSSGTPLAKLLRSEA